MTLLAELRAAGLRVVHAGGDRVHVRPAPTPEQRRLILTRKLELLAASLTCLLTSSPLRLKNRCSTPSSLWARFRLRLPGAQWMARPFWRAMRCRKAA